MFSFLPQLLIIVALAGITVIVLRRTVPVNLKIRQAATGGARKLWHFVLEAKDFSRTSAAGRNFLQKFRLAKIAIPKPHLPFFRPSNSLESYLQRGQTLLEAEDYPGAERQFIRAIELDPKNEPAFAALGKLYLLQKKFEEAAETYNFLLKLHPENDTYWANLGQAYHNERLYEKAIAAYEKAIDLNPENPRRYINLGLTLEAKKHLEEAILNYRRAVDLEKGNTQFLLVLAEALAKKGEKNEAEIIFEQILVLEPTNHLAREKLMALKF